ncbi:MAG: exosome complex exonuclease Rrp41 [Candidatus Diapherotrites archaeon]|nr:exosome complex exonuclease Rrp41 [Candidatus Diapherotrites archaeon]
MSNKNNEEPVYVNKQGLRLDGRKVDETRKIKITSGVLPRADGSCYLEWGQNKIIAGVYGPREALPAHTQDPTKANVNFVYRMASFSVPDRKNPKPGRRDIEISKVCGEAFEKTIFLEKFPNAVIDIYVEILDSNAGSRVAAITAASVALADAGIPMRDMVAAVAVGKAGGHILVDLNKDEEDASDAVDMPMAILPSTEEIVLLQMDGVITKDEWTKAIDLGLKACKKVYELQKNALKEKYIQAESSKENKVE